MADLTITAANVENGSRTGTKAARLAANEVIYVAEATITAGQSVYLNTSTVKVNLADSDATATALLLGVALHGASANQPCVVQVSGNIDLGATLTIGETYVVSTTAGGIAPIGDLLSGDFVTILGIADATDNLVMGINSTGVAKA